MKTTYMANPNTIERKWYVVDAEGKTLGRLAAEVAKVLRGKNKPTFTPHVDTGEHVIVVNAEKIRDVYKRQGFTYADKLHNDGLQVVAIGNIGERAFLDSLVTTATITGCEFSDILVHTECGPTIEQRAAHIHSFVDRFNIAVDDWSALSESERRDAVLHLLQVAGGLDIACLLYTSISL